MADDVAVTVPDDDALAVPKSSITPPKVTKKVEEVVEKENKVASNQNIPVAAKEPTAAISKPPVVATVSAVIDKPAPPAVEPEAHAVLGGAYHKVPDFHVSPARQVEKPSVETVEKLVSPPVVSNEPKSMSPQVARNISEQGVPVVSQRATHVAPANSVTFSDAPQTQSQQQYQVQSPQQYQQQQPMPGYNQGNTGPAHSQAGQAAHPPAPPPGQGFDMSQPQGGYSQQQPYGPGQFQQNPMSQSGAGYPTYHQQQPYGGQQPYYPPYAPPNMYWADPRCSYGAMPPLPPGYPCGGGYPNIYQRQEYDSPFGSRIHFPFGARDPGQIRQSLGSIYCQGFMSSTERPTGSGAAVDSSVLEILKELKQAKVSLPLLVRISGL